MKYFLFLLVVFPFGVFSQVESRYPIKVTYDGVVPAMNIAVFNLEGRFLDSSNEFGMATVPESEISMPLVFYKLGWKKDTIKVRISNPTVDIKATPNRFLPSNNRQAAKDFLDLNEKNIELYRNDGQLMKFKYSLDQITQKKQFKEEGSFLRKVKNGYCSYGICKLKNFDASDETKKVITNMLRAELRGRDKYSLADNNRMINEYLEGAINEYLFNELINKDSTKTYMLYINKKELDAIIEIKMNKDNTLSRITSSLISGSCESNCDRTFYREMEYVYGRDQELKRLTNKTLFLANGASMNESFLKLEAKEKSGEYCARPTSIRRMYRSFKSK
jgi:hypothetical protein